MRECVVRLRVVFCVGVVLGLGLVSSRALANEESAESICAKLLSPKGAGIRSNSVQDAVEAICTGADEV